MASFRQRTIQAGFGRPISQRDSLENPSIPLGSPQAWALIAGQTSTDAGVNINEYTAMRTMAVWRCIHLIAGTISQFPLHVWEGTRADVGARKAIDVGWTVDPNPEVTWMELMETSMAHELLWGNAYWLPVLNNGGTDVSQIWALPPWQVEPLRKSSPKPGIPGPKAYNVRMGSGVQLTDADLVHFPGLGYDGIRGLSPISYAREALGVGEAAQQYGARLFGSGSLMAGILQTDQKLTPDQAETMKARWREKVTGLTKAHEAVVLDAGLKWTAVGIPPEEAQFLQTRNFGIEEVGRLYGVPPHLMMQVEKTTTWGSGIAEQSLSFVRYTLSQWTSRFEQRITKRLCQKGQYAEFDNSQLLKGDTASRYASYGTAIASGFMTRNQALGYEGQPRSDQPGMDDYLLPVAAVKAGPPADPKDQ